MTTTKPETPVDEKVDLSDLDLLDDQLRHAVCNLCYPPGTPPLGVPFRALCGKRAVWLYRWTVENALPPNACPACIEAPGCFVCRGGLE